MSHKDRAVTILIVFQLLVLAPRAFAQTYPGYWAASSLALPSAVCSPWTLVTNVGSPVLSGGLLHISTSANSQNQSYLLLSPAFAMPDTLISEFGVRLISGSSSNPARAPIMILGTTSPNVGYLMGIDADEVFLNSGHLVKGPSATVDTNGSLHTYRIEVFGTSEGSLVKVYHDGVLILEGATYTDPLDHGSVARIGWGEGSSGAFGASDWQFYTHNGATTGCDADEDGLYDGWEGVGILLAGGGKYELPGANPRHKDLFVEVDALKGLKPMQGAIDDVISKFAVAPVAGNPDSLPGISLHVQIDEEDGDAVDWELWGDFDFYKNTSGPQSNGHFGTEQERTQPNWAKVREAKTLVYRYCVFAHKYDRTKSGKARNFHCRDFVVTLGGWGATSRSEQAGTFMHELGHSLGLHHGGNDDKQAKPNYFSVMNYIWQAPVRLNSGCGDASFQQLLDYNGSWELNYSSGALPSLYEDFLSEPAGIGGDPAKVVPVGPPGGMSTMYSQIVPMGGPVNWDRVGLAVSDGVVADANYVKDCNNAAEISPGETLNDHDDWGVLQLPVPSESAQRAANEESLMELDDELSLENLLDLGALQLDCNLNGIPDGHDIVSGHSTDTNGNGIPDECEAGTVGVDIMSRPSSTLIKCVTSPAFAGARIMISFGLSSGGAIKLIVYNASGALVRTVIDGHLESGSHIVSWDGHTSSGQTVSAGVYFIRLTSSFGNAVTKVVIVK